MNNMKAYFKNASWIAPAEPMTVTVFKRSFTVEKIPESALIDVTGLGYFELYINGNTVTNDRLIPVASDYFRRDFSVVTYPVRDFFTHRIYFHTFDIAKLLRGGENEIKIICGGGWFVQNERIAEGKMGYSDRPRCIYELSLDGKVIASDGSELYSDCEIRETSLFIGEIIDYTYTQREWGRVNTLPAPDTIMTPTDATPDRIIRKIRPTLVSERSGKRIYDAGENVSAVVLMRTRAAFSEKYTLRFAEYLDSDGELDFTSAGATQIGTSGKPQIMTDIFISDGVAREFMPRFTWHAFRYFEVEGNPDGIEDAEVLVIHSDVTVTAEFESDSEGASFLFDAYIRTQLQSYHGSYPSDCPHRERLGYTGDGQVCAPAAMMMLDSKQLYRKWIRDILDSQDIKTGRIQHTAPFQGGGGGPCGWGVAVITVPYAFIKQFGDKSILEDTLPAMRRYIEFTESCMENGLVVRESEGGWCLGDWVYLESGKLPEPFVNTALFVRALRLYAEMSGRDEFSYLEEISLAAVKREYEALRHIGAARVWAAYIGIDSAAAVNEYYSALGKFDTGFLATDALVEILFSGGYADTAHKLLSSSETGSFLEMKRFGATTLFEAWGCRGSGSHPMFGACTRSLFEGILGIRQEKGSYGYEKISISPALPGDMNYARGSILTPKGRISVSLLREGEKVKANITLPESITLVGAEDRQE